MVQLSRSNYLLWRSGLAWALLLSLALSTAWADGSSQRGWGSAQRIDNNDYANAPVIAADNRGNAIAIWEQFDALPQQYGVWTNRYTAGKGWGTPERINDYVGQAAQLTLVANGRGEALAVWIQYGLFDQENPSAPVHTSLWSSRLSPGKGWSTPVQIQDATTIALFPKAAIDEHGNAIVVWSQQNAALDILNVYGRHYSRKDGWGDTQLLQADPTMQGYLPQIAMSEGDDATIVWSQIDQTTYIFTVASARYSAKTGWSAQETLPGSDGAGAPLVGSDARGNAIAVWTMLDLTTYQDNVFASRYSVKRGWDAPELLQLGTDVNGGQLRLAMNGSGQAIALWKETIFSYSGDFGYEMRSNRYVPGKGWQGSQLILATISPDTGGSNPQIAMDETGSAIAVWEQPNFAALTNPYDQAPANIQAFRYTPSRGWNNGTPIQNGTDPASNAQVSVTQNGDAFAVWQQQDMTTGATSLWANHYDKP